MPANDEEDGAGAHGDGPENGGGGAEEEELQDQEREEEGNGQHGDDELRGAGAHEGYLAANLGVAAGEGDDAERDQQVGEGEGNDASVHAGEVALPGVAGDDEAGGDESTGGERPVGGTEAVADGGEAAGDVDVSAAGTRHGGGEDGVAEGGEEGGEDADDEGERDVRSDARDLLLNAYAENIDATADDVADGGGDEGEET